MSPVSISFPAAAATHEFSAHASGFPAHIDVPQDPQEAAKKVEGMFLSMLLKELRETSNGEGLFPGDSAGIHGGIFDMVLGEFIAENSPGLGIGQEIARYLQAAQGGTALGNGLTDDDAAPPISPDTTL